MELLCGTQLVEKKRVAALRDMGRARDENHRVFSRSTQTVCMSVCLII